MLVTSNYQLLDTLKTSIAVTKDNSEIIYVNHAWRRFAEDNNYSGMLTGFKYLDVCDVADGAEHEDAVAFREGFLGVAAGELPFYELIYPCHSPRERRWFKTIIQPFGELVLVSHVNVTDAITGLLPIKERSDLIHDLKSPLNAIIGYADFSLGASPETLSAAKLREVFQIIRLAGDRMINLVTALLGEARQREHLGAETCNNETIDIRSLVSEVVSQHQPAAMASQLELSATTIDEVSLIADHQVVWRILSNLVSNAIKFTRPNGRVLVKMDLNNSGGIQIGVQDTGLGIKPEKLTQIFKASVRDGGTEADLNAPGSGLGLAIVQELVGLHDGKLRISSAPGSGTLMTVEFPAWRTVRAEQPETALADYGCTTCLQPCPI